YRRDRRVRVGVDRVLLLLGWRRAGQVVRIRGADLRPRGTAIGRPGEHVPAKVEHRRVGGVYHQGRVRGEPYRGSQVVAELERRLRSVAVVLDAAAVPVLRALVVDRVVGLVDGRIVAVA